MDIVKIEHCVSSILKNSKAQGYREKGYVYYHGKRVAELAMELFLEVKKDVTQSELDRLYIAGLMHDIAKGKKHHAEVGAKMAAKLIGPELAENDICEVQRLVREHNLREKPNICELDAKALQDADVLDHFGVQGVWLSVYYTAKNDGNQGDMLKYYFSREHHEYAEQKFYSLNFDVSKTKFQERYNYQKTFLELISDM